MTQAGRQAAVTWTLWGFATAILGLANLAVMGFDPVPNQHGVVGTGTFLVALGAAAASQALWPDAPRWVGVAAFAAACVLFFAGSAMQHVLGEAFVYGLGDAGAASQEAPVALLGAIWAAALTVALARSVPWWPGAAATVLLLGLYVWASSWGWGWGGDAGATLFGGAVLNGLLVLVFVAAGWSTAAAAARTARTQAAAGPARA
jgi:hypothetical protein